MSPLLLTALLWPELCNNSNADAVASLQNAVGQFLKGAWHRGNFSNGESQSQLLCTICFCKISGRAQLWEVCWLEASQPFLLTLKWAIPHLLLTVKFLFFICLTQRRVCLTECGASCARSVFCRNRSAWECLWSVCNVPHQQVNFFWLATSNCAKLGLDKL